MPASSVEGLTPILLRSSTPAPNEKVLQYLEGMSREGEEPDNTPPRSLIDPDEYRSRVGSPRLGSRLGSPRVRSPGAASNAPLSPRSKNGEPRHDLPNSPMSYTNRNGGHALNPDDHDDDIDSNFQEGRTSEAGGTVLPVREPGPHDPPGPKYESYDSGPSFGNFGPLPSDDPPSNNPLGQSSWNPNWSQIQSKPPGTDAGQSVHAARVPLPPSEFAMSPRGTNTDFQRREEPMSPRSIARSQSGKERAMSPLSTRSRLTTKTGMGTAYPPLPESKFGDDDMTETPGVRSPPMRSKAASISPSESPSQMRVPQSPSVKAPSRAGSRMQQYNGARSQGPGSIMSAGHQSRPFSPYRHAPTHEDLLHAAIRGRGMVIPEEEEKASTVARSKAPSQISKAPSQSQSQVKAPSQLSKAPSQAPTQTQSQVNGHDHGIAKAPSSRASTKQPTVRTDPSHHEHEHDHGDVTPRARALSPDDLDQEEARIVRAALAATPRTSYYAEPLEPGVANHYHDLELCVLLRQESDPNAHEVVKKAMRKAVMQRVKKLGMKHDHESLKQYKRAHQDHNPSVYLRDDDPPQWAADIKRELVLMQQRIESLGPKIENLRAGTPQGNDSRFAYDGDDFTRTPVTQTVHLGTQPTGTMADSMFQGQHPEEHDGQWGDTDGGETRTINRHAHAYGTTEDRDDSPGQQFLEEELYRLRQRRGSDAARSHHTWEVAREQDDHEHEFNDAEDERKPPSGLPTIPDGDADRDASGSPPLPALPDEDEDDDHEGGMVAHGGVLTTPQGPWSAVDYSGQPQDAGPQLTPWQRIHARLLSWAVIWPQSEIDAALNSTTRGQQVDEVALSIWSTQTYKRYVRARLTDNPPGIVDRLFVPPNMADAISNAVYNGQHGNACGMLRDLWSPFGLPGMPRLLVVLAKHRSEADHWVVHRYSLPEGTLITYDSYSGRTLMDGRPLGWWFAIRIAWPNANYPNPERLEQKMVRLHRPTQLPIDNSVAAAGIWRNILMGSRGERSLDLERLRDLINTEVKNLRQRKILGRLSVTPARQAWEHMN